MKKSELKHMKLHHCLAGTLGVIGLIVGLQPTIVPAATVDVGDAAALGSAIANCADGDTIVLTNNITVSGEVALSGKGLTIQGNHHSVCVPVPGLNGSGVLNASPSTFRVFNLNASGKTNTLHNMTVMGGNPSSNGGGILNSGGTLVLQDVTVAQSGGANCSGGGLQNSSGTVYLRDCNIKYNAANYGGGFLNSGTGAMMFIERCTFSGNQSLSSNGGGGAGENQQTLYANNSTFANNKSTELGGAINNYGGTSYFVDCTFVGNVAYSTGYMGGAIAQHIGGANSGTLSLVNSLFAYNYHFNGSTFDLNDIYNYSGTAPLAYHSIFQSTTNQLGSSSVGITVYAGDIGGTNDTLFSCGGTAQVLGPSGTPIGSGTIYQPSVAIVGASQTPTAVLKPGSFAFGKGARAAFSSAPATPVVGYYNGSSWTALSGSSPANYEVITDQNGTARGDSATVGAVTSTASGPSITAAPDSQTVPVGGTVTLSVTATGTGPLYYQWFKNGGMVPEAIDSTLTLTGAGVVNSGVYYVVVTNPYGLSISLPVTVTVGAPQLLAWGDNYYGQLGDGTKIDKQLPEAVASGVIAAAAGADHSLFVKADGSLWAVGFNGDGELGDGTTATLTQPESIATNVVAVAAGAWHSLFLKRDGTLWGMGANYNGQLGDGTQNQRVNPVTIASNVVALAAGWYHSLYLKTDGTLWGMGSNCSGQLGNGTTLEQDLAVSVASNVVALAAGSWHSLYLKIDGTLWGMGANSYGQLGDGNNTGAYLAVSVASNVVALAAGSVHSLFLTKDETLWAMGDNGSGQLGNGTNTAAYLPESVVSNVVAVTAGMYDSLCLKSDGTLWAMGANSVGQLGDGTKTTRYSPVAVPGMSVATVVSSGSANHTLAIGVPLAPVITGQPASQTVLAGSPVTFTVTATSLTPLAYQWQFNGTNLLSATNASYTLARAALSDAGTYTVSVANLHGATVSAPATLTVTQPMANITVAADPANAGSASGGGTFLIGSTNLCSATASNGWTFVAWSDGSTTNPYAIVVETNLTLTAKFAPTVTVTVAANPTNAGSVSGGGVLIIGSNTVLTATASNNWAFVAWNDGATNNPYAITVPATNITYTATFAPTATITVEASPNTGGSVTGGGTFLIGSTNRCSATASNGWTFVAWSDGSTINPYAIVVVTNLTLTAKFAPTVTVTVAANPTNAGSVSGGGVLIIGSNTVLTATASNNWAFVAWNDGATNNPCTITVPATNITYTATFAPTATITVEASPNTGGSVTGGGTFLIGSTNRCSATASNGWAFVAWSDGSTINPYAIVVETNLTLTAKFAPTVTVTVSANPTNAGSVSGGGVLIIGSNMVLTATASNNWAFVAWNDGATNNPCTITVPATNITYTATFAPTATITVVANPSGAGSVSGGGTFVVGSTHPITAVASNGWIFVGWSNGSTNNPCALMVASNLTITATFVSAATVTTLALPPEGGLTSGDGTYAIGGSASVTATATNGWVFLNWNGTVTNNPYVITVPATNITYTASFARTATITVVANPSAAGTVSGGGTFLVGSTNVIAAASSNNWVFTGWSDGATNNPHAIVVESNRTYAANFAAAAMVTTLAVPAQGGSTTGGGTYAIGTTATLTATPSNGWIFLNWNGTVTNYTQTGNTNNPLGVRVASSINYAANFAQVENGFVYTVINKKGTASAEIIGYTGPKTDTIVVPSVIGGLAVTTIGTGAFWWFNYSKIVLPGSIEAVETGAIDAGILDLTALGDLAGFVVEAGAFAEMGEILLGIGVSAAMIAYLADLCENLVAVQAAADPERGGYCTGSGLYIAGTPVLVTASANSGWRFNGWSDGGIPNKYWVTAPYTVTARFVPVSTVTVVANPEDGGLVSGGGTFDVGSQIILKATNNIYWKFMEWSDGDTNATHTIQVPASDITYTATFEELKLELEVEADPTIGGYAFGSGEYGLSEIVTLSAIPFPTWKFKRWGPDLHILTNGPVPPLFSFIVTPGMLGQKLKLDAAFSTDVKIGWVANPYYAGSVEAEEAYEWPPVLQDLPLMTAVPADGWEFVSWDTPVTTNNTSNPFCPLLGLVQPFDFTVTANFTPTRLVTFVSSNSLTLNWPTNQIGWLLQAQTNGLSSGVSNDWHDLPGTGAANSLVVPIDPANRAVFYRLRQP